jgi:hypothetical protein
MLKHDLLLIRSSIRLFLQKYTLILTRCLFISRSRNGNFPEGNILSRFQFASSKPQLQFAILAKQRLSSRKRAGVIKTSNAVK